MFEEKFILHTCTCNMYMYMYIHMNKGEKLSPSQGLNLGLPITSQILLPPGLLRIGAENITTGVVILIVHRSILY